MDIPDITCIPYINKDYLYIKVKHKILKFKTINIKLDSNNKEDFKSCKYAIEKVDDNKDEINYFIKFIQGDKVIHKEKIYLLNVKYYLTGPCNKRINKKPFYSYIEKRAFNLEDINALLKREKIDDIYKIDPIKIKKKGEKYFENMSNKEYFIDENEFVILELHYKKLKEKENLINIYNKEIMKIYNKINKDSENVKKYDLIYLYAAPLVKDDSGKSSKFSKISYREEIKIIIDIMKKKKKQFKCLFQCLSVDVLRDVLENKKAKILHISSHGIIDDKSYSLVLENLEKCGQEQIVKTNTLQTLLQSNPSNINNMDLIVLATCHSGHFKELFTKFCKPKNIIYVDPNEGINDKLCVSFCEYFYSELTEGKTIKDSFENTISKLKSNSRLLSILQGQLKIEIQKLYYYFSKQIDCDLSPFKFNGEGELSINANVKINFITQKYKSLIGRMPILVHVFKEIQFNNDNQFVVIYGKKGLEKLDFAESLCVYLFERKIIENFEILDEFEIGENFLEITETKINEMQQNAKYSQKKAVIIVKIQKNEGLIKKIKHTFNKYKNCYFIIVIDLEVISDEAKQDKHYFSAFLDEYNAEVLFKEIYASYGRNPQNIIFSHKNSLSSIFHTKEFEPKKISKLVDYYILYNSFDKININDIENDNIERTISLTPLYAYLYLLSKMPSGLPDCFVQLIFKENFDDDLISKYTKNNWNYINTDIQFNNLNIVEENINNKEENNKGYNKKTFEDFEKYSLQYMLKTLKLYAKLLYFYIEKDREEIIYPDENIHLIFNSYNNEGIWKSNIPNIKDEERIKENEFINKDFNIKNHYENIYNLINYLVNKLEYFDEAFMYIEYLIEILLLFPSYFFLKKICKYYIKKCKEFCTICQEHYKKNNEKMKEFAKYKTLEAKLKQINNIFQEIEDFKDKDLPYDNNIKAEFELINNQKNDLKKQVEKCKEIYGNWKENYIKKFQEIEKKFEYQNAKLSLFLYSIDCEEIKNLPKDKDLELELYILKFLKNKDEHLREILQEEEKNPRLSTKMKSILYYELAIYYYSEKNIDESEEYLQKALSYSKGFKFIYHRIFMDLCYIDFNKINSSNPKDKSNKKNQDTPLKKIIEENIKNLDKLLKDVYSDKLHNEELNLRQKFYDLLEPNTIMLNSNPLKNGYNILSSGIYAYQNNQYYILDKLNELGKEDKIKSYIRMKSYILNKKNLNEALKKKGEILIIQSDDYTENGDIMLESEKGISEKLTKNEFMDIIDKQDSKKIFKFKIVILSFINCSKMFEYIKDKVEFEYLIYFQSNNIKSVKKKVEYNQLCVEFIIDFISSYPENNYNDEDLVLFTPRNFDEKLKKSILKSNFEYKIVKKGININNPIKYGEKGIFFLDPLLKLPSTEFSLTNKVYNGYNNEMIDIIEKLLIGQGQSFYCNKQRKEKYLKMSFEIIKFFYKHKTFLKFYYINVEKGDKIESISKDKEDKNIPGQTKQNNYFYLVYNCRYSNSMDILNILLNNNNSYIIIYDEEGESDLEEEDNYELESSSDYENNNSDNKMFSAFEYKGNYSEPDSENEYIVDNIVGDEDY